MIPRFIDADLKRPEGRTRVMEAIDGATSACEEDLLKILFMHTKQKLADLSDEEFAKIDLDAVREDDAYAYDE